MARRIASFHESDKREVYAFQRVESREFDFAGHKATLTDDRSDPRAPILVVKYADHETRIPVSVPPDVESARWKLPGLIPHEDWLRVLRMAPRGGMTTQEWLEKRDSGQLEQRLILVARIPQPGADPQTWGNVWKKLWSFDFYELMPDGSIARHARLKYPTTRGIKAPKIGELRENTWQFQAALQTMPQAGSVGPTHNFFGNAVAAAGWTLPAAAFSGLLATMASVFSLAPRSNESRSWRQRGIQAPPVSR
jgi:hypothetical protein